MGVLVCSSRGQTRGKNRTRVLQNFLLVRSLLTRKDERQRGLQDHLADGQVRATDEPGRPGFSRLLSSLLSSRWMDGSPRTIDGHQGHQHPTIYDRSALAASSRPPVLPSSRPPVLPSSRPPVLPSLRPPVLTSSRPHPPPTLSLIFPPLDSRPRPDVQVYQARGGRKVL